MNNIKKRWGAADQEIFITAVILNSFYQNSPFAPLHFLNNAVIHALLNHLWRHFYNEDPPAAFSQKIAKYLQQTGLFANLASSVQIHLNASSREAKSPDPLALYKDFEFAGHEPEPFIHLAKCILSVCTNSTSCEWLFSIFGNILTKTAWVYKQ
ncbi:hypothetical protein PILCRDRAFT_12140 [Piloderma croceum F 1598]|uniref:HAT C-terminal dimerisation domain-containing protein n=1 Tax=Piloderma croceum (strain F 1598) TaxID=765440 RepID=A0A0C3BIY5_PILCF|nr:hypothetical protein PILCRDRAFT_12140 [Piloderma croceum F 1598]